ncbi:putative U box domain, Zinc finger, RING/FYVE/PHD-type [Arabidopsis thaliana]
MRTLATPSPPCLSCSMFSHVRFCRNSRVVSTAAVVSPALSSSNAVNLEICVAATVLTPLTPLLGLYFGSQAHWQLNLFGEHIKGFVGIIFCPRRICPLLAMPKLHRDVCARNYLHFITRCGRSSCRWKLQDLGVNPGFKPCVRYIIHLRKQRTFFNTVLSHHWGCYTVEIEKPKYACMKSLRRMEDIVPRSSGFQLWWNVVELLLDQLWWRRHALKKLIDWESVEEDKGKDSIVAYILHLMKKKSGQIFIPPEEQISLQLMRDPVIVASGQTYERVCVEKWFCDGKL